MWIYNYAIDDSDNNNINITDLLKQTHTSGFSFFRKASTFLLSAKYLASLSISTFNSSNVTAFRLDPLISQAEKLKPYVHIVLPFDMVSSQST